MASIKEISEAVLTAKKNGCKKIILLKSTSGYPSSSKDANLLSIPYLINKFKCPVGLSDHTLGSIVPVSSIAHGAIMIGKHLKLNNKSSNPDSHFSLNPKQFKEMVYQINQAYEAKGKIFFGVTKSEKNSVKYRRSIIAVKKINKNEVLNDKNIKVLRPAIGLEPKFYNHVIGYRAKKKINIGDPIKLSKIYK